MSTGHECHCGVTPPHPTFGACARSKNIRVGWCQSAAGKDFSKSKAWSAELQAYRDAVGQGIAPEGTTMAKIRDAERKSQAIGQPYGTPEYENAVQTRMREKYDV